jgi:hypothetical protein
MLYAVKNTAGLYSIALMHIDAKHHTCGMQTIHSSHDLQVMVHKRVWTLVKFHLVLVSRDIRNKHPCNVQVTTAQILVKSLALPCD